MIAFLVGWFLFGLLSAIIIAVVVLLLMGTLRIGSSDRAAAKRGTS